MDPLTHTLLGANLAASRLGEKTRLAAAALVIGVNLPDIDSFYYFTGQQDFALGFRRGWTHGVLALLVLPLLQTALLLLYDRLRPHAARRAHAGWLLALSFGAILTHPFLDWLNNYGMRWLMPFDGRWFYGDAVYIMDPALWLILGIGFLLTRRATLLSVGLWAVATGLIVRIVTGRAPEYLSMVAIVAAILLAALLWKPASARWPAAATMLAFAYIAMRLTLNELTEARVESELARREMPAVALMAAPHPIDPRQWSVVAQTAGAYRFGRYSWGRGLTLDALPLPLPAPTPQWEAARQDPSVRGFMTWVRFPWYEIEESPTATRVLIHDARYAVRRRPGGGFGGVVVELPKATVPGPPATH